MASSAEDTKIEVMFFKGKGSILDKLIRLVTGSKYSHVAIRITVYKNTTWYESISWHGVRKGYYLHRGLERDWDSVTINKAYKKSIEATYERYKEYGYSYTNLVFKLLGFKPFKHNLDCVEFANRCLNLVTPKTPQELYELLRYGGV